MRTRTSRRPNCWNGLTRRCAVRAGRPSAWRASIWSGASLTFAGVGNVSAQIYSGAKASQHLVSVNGTAGHQMHRIREFSYPWPDDGMLVMHSDGLSTNAGLEKHSGLALHDPSLIAGVLYRDFTRRNDDATVVVAKAALRQESMSLPILSFSIRYEHDTVTARQRARQIARLLGFDDQDQTRISTAVSEIARNAFNYAGGGRVEYLLEGRTAPQLFIIRVTDSGAGIRDLNAILEGRYQSQTGMGLGIIGARRLMDQFQIESEPGQGHYRLAEETAPQARPPGDRDARLAAVASALVAERPQDPFQELQHQNQELLGALEEIRTRQAELTRLNRELEDTNRGVVALYAELDEKADHLRRADELKSKFLSNMSHEFRSPLNSILALSGLLLGRSDGDLTAEQDAAGGLCSKGRAGPAGTGERSAGSGQSGSRQGGSQADRIRSRQSVCRPARHAAPAAAQPIGRPHFRGRVDHIPRMFSDEGKISQILRNFISNALKFTERGEIRVSASLAGNGEVRFSVADTGIGIAPEDLDLIFQDFAQVDNPIQKRVRGTGLGLPLSKKLAALLGGRVRVESQLGVGSEFALQVPHSLPATSASPPRRPWSGCRIPPACRCWWWKTARK